ncbi:uncharacterized protein LOC132560894 [Ylistrum balloti]|uniref:uncharacterized protein LOC132560894 n=1 Tax=Ylistrum balloti TaxID=509963 RepID=UPI002905F437|nr:uncharacterized protein LOC132560894 [Ylistrum balloti]
MRPDEHKKKRSAQYKKKHGMNKDDQSRDSRQPKSKSSGKGKVKVDQKPGGKHSEGHVTGATKLPQSSSGSDTSDNDQDSAPVRPAFRRREVVSNWTRYEILPSETEATQRKGEDFLNLLNTAGVTSSQFRFKEEEAWDEGESVSTDTKLLAVDLSDLAASLQCIPLYNRLGLEQDLFSSEQIQEMETAAKEHTQEYKPKSYPVDPTHKYKPKSYPVDPTHEYKPKSLVSDLTQKYKPGSQAVDISEQNKPVGSDSAIDSTLPTKDNDKVTRVVETGKTKTEPDETGSIKQEAGEHLIKAESDCQKSADDVSIYNQPSHNLGASGCVDSAPVVRTPVINTNICEKTGEVTSNNLDDDLDFLLSLDNPSDATSLGETTQQNSVNVTVKTSPDKKALTSSNTGLEKETENLEDWLDSVLD